MINYLPLPKETFPAPTPNGTCHDPRDMEIVGCGGHGRTNIHNRWYAGYWCDKCKKMYMEHYSKHRTHFTYSPKETQAHLKWEREYGDE